MVTSGTVIEHPVTGEKIVFRKTARETGGELLQVDLYCKPGGFVAAAHVHPSQEERFEIIAGTLRSRIAGKESSSKPGDIVVIPKGTPHVWWNGGTDELHVLAEVRPALKFENFFETFFGLAQDGKVHPKTGLPNLLRMALILRKYRNEVVLAQPPQLVQRILFGMLAPVGKLLGYSGDHPYPYARQAESSV